MKWHFFSLLILKYSITNLEKKKFFQKKKLKKFNLYILLLKIIFRVIYLHLIFSSNKEMKRFTLISIFVDFLVTERIFSFFSLTILVNYKVLISVKKKELQIYKTLFF